jgi:hypothetical protein
MLPVNSRVIQNRREVLDIVNILDIKGAKKFG